MYKRIDRFLFGRIKVQVLAKLHKAISLVIAYIIIIGFLALVLTFVVPQIITSITEMIALVQSVYWRFDDMLQTFSSNHPNIDLAVVEEFVNKNLPQLLNYAKDYMTNALPMIFQTGRLIIGWVVNIILAFVISCYLLWDKNGILNSLKRFVSALVSEANAKKIFRTTKECNRIFSKYIIGKALDSLIIGVLCFVLMCILKLPYALLLSVFVGVTNMIPYFGPFIGAVPGVLLLLLISPKSCIVFVIMILALQQFDGAILGPKIIGNSTGLSPIGVIFGILAGGYLAGVLGMFVGVPVVAVIMYLINKVIDFQIHKRRLKENPDYDERNDIPRMSDEELGFKYQEMEEE